MQPLLCGFRSAGASVFLLFFIPFCIAVVGESVITEIMKWATACFVFGLVDLRYGNFDYGKKGLASLFCMRRGRIIIIPHLPGPFAVFLFA